MKISLIFGLAFLAAAATLPISARAQVTFTASPSLTPVKGEPVVGASNSSATSVPSSVDASTMPLNGVAYATISGIGTGYSSACTISGGGGQGATCVALLNSGSVYQIIVTNPGSNYTSAPTVTVASGTGQTFTAALIADACDQINAAWGALYSISPSGGINDARAIHGTQNCAAQFASNYPYDPAGSQAGIFNGQLDLSPAINIRTAVQQIIPNGLIVDGHSTHPLSGPYYALQTGAVIQAANTFPANTAIIEYGATNGGSGAPSDGMVLQNLGINCIPPNNTPIAGTIGLQNQFAQDNSGSSWLHIQGCHVGLDVENGGTLGGAQNSGPWTNTFITTEGLNDATAVCVQYGTTASNMISSRGFEHTTCTGGEDAVEPTYGILVDGSLVKFSDTHVEEVGTGFEIGANHQGNAVSIRDTYCIGDTVAFSITTCVDIPSNNEYPVTVENVYATTSHVTNVLVDHNLNGGTIAVSCTPKLGLYIRESAANMLSTSPCGPVSTIVTGPTISFFMPSLMRNLSTLAFSPSANTQYAYPVEIPYSVTFGHICVNLTTHDTNASNFYNVALVNKSNAIIAQWGAQNLTGATGATCFANAAGSATITPGIYYLVTTGSATTAAMQTSSDAGGLFPLSNLTCGTSASGAIATVTLAFGTGPTQYSSAANPNFYLY